MIMKNIDCLKFSVLSRPAGDALMGTDGQMYLGEEPLLGTLTATLRGFSLKTARAPGDWPEGSVFDSGPVRF
jgi:hypothetical protein